MGKVFMAVEFLCCSARKCKRLLTILITSGILVITCLSILVACSTGQVTYCADIERYNPRTQKESSYRTTVLVHDDILLEIHWPNGGRSEEDDFGSPKFKDNKTSFSNKKNVQYKIALVKRESDCYEDFSGLKQCSGKTKEGLHCKNMTGHESERCHAHRK